MPSEHSDWYTCNIFILGIDVHVVVDCCSSRSMTDRKFALERLRDVGAFLTTSESVILGLAPDAAHPKFKQIQKLVMHSASDTGLLWNSHTDFSSKTFNAINNASNDHVKSEIVKIDIVGK